MNELLDDDAFDALLRSGVVTPDRTGDPVVLREKILSRAVAPASNTRQTEAGHRPAPDHALASWRPGLVVAATIMVVALGAVSLSPPNSPQEQMGTSPVPARDEPAAAPIAGSSVADPSGADPVAPATAEAFNAVPEVGTRPLERASEAALETLVGLNVDDAAAVARDAGCTLVVEGIVPEQSLPGSEPVVRVSVTDGVVTGVVTDPPHGCPGR